MAVLVDWYFDPNSPFAYLQAEQLGVWLSEPDIQVHPVVLGALLSYWETRGPAEIPAKRRQTYRSALARAATLGIPMRFPPAHPFDPLPLLRLTVAAGSTFQVAREVLRYIWRDGGDATDLAELAALGHRLQVADPLEAIQDQAVKLGLRRNTERAIARGIFGVPSLFVAGEIFWGEDATQMARLTFEQGSDWLREQEWGKIASLPVGIERKPQRPHD